MLVAGFAINLYFIDASFFWGGIIHIKKTLTSVIAGNGLILMDRKGELLIH